VRIFLYEFVSGGGWFGHSSEPPPASLLAEGGAMLSAVAADLVAAGHAVDVTRDRRHDAPPLSGCAIHEVASADQERAAFERLAAAADWSLLIAPEFDGWLRRKCAAVKRVGGRLLGSSSQVVALTADKHATAEHLAHHGVPVPRGVPLERDTPLPVDFAYPAVLKPRDGAGSLGVELIAASRPARCVAWPARLEAQVPGIAASVAVLAGPRGVWPLAPCRQILGGTSGFCYLGGSLPLEPELAARAARLAERAVRTLDGPRGYLGVDLVLGPERDGSADAVIEINPRLTTSYVGLRALLDGNLAASMLAIAAGEPAELCWKPGQIAFDAAGRVENSGPAANPRRGGA
jgi:hypothetical protein